MPASQKPAYPLADYVPLPGTEVRISLRMKLKVYKAVILPLSSQLQ